ncbi:natriuretic peptides A-like [Hyperolius riggenbachi]|uniref:natriuretic peptides A-like n=1 Tax=Hyperolius riggenbachi TaxID=752182 RepID=UPI0035A3032A
MDCKDYLWYSSLLLVLLHLQYSAGYPVADQDTDTEMDSFKDILGNLEEKMSLLEALEGHLRAGESSRPEDSASQPEEMEAPLSRSEAVSKSQPFPISNSLLKRFRSLQSPKMLRGSSCFGGRMDRIDSTSRMGCNGSRRM